MRTEYTDIELASTPKAIAFQKQLDEAGIPYKLSLATDDDLLGYTKTTQFVIRETRPYGHGLVQVFFTHRKPDNTHWTTKRRVSERVLAFKDGVECTQRDAFWWARQYCPKNNA